MGFHVNTGQFDTWLTEQKQHYDIYAPKCFPGGNTFSDVDCIRYGKVSSISEIVFDQKSEYSFKEVLTPISQTLFFFTEDQCREADPPKKGAILFLRSCDLHALKRLDDLYLHNGPADYDKMEEVNAALQSIIEGLQINQEAENEGYPKYHCLHRQPGLSLCLL